MMKYRLTVSGTIEFRTDKTNEHVRQLLQGEQSAMQAGVAIRELEEGAVDVKVEMVELEQVPGGG